MKKIRRILILIFFTSSLLMLVAIRSQNAAKKINGTVCNFVRELLNRLTAPFSVSVFELVVFFSPLLIFLAVRYVLKGEFNAKVRFLKVLSLFSLIPTLFFLTIGISAHTCPIVRVGTSSPTYEELVICSEKLIEEVNVQPDIKADVLSIKELRSELEKSYFEIARELGIDIKKLPEPKVLSASWLANRLGILGHYSFLTGEININPDIPTYMIPFSLAHEYAHYIGIANEAEANFLAFLACTKSNEPYIKYSGTLSTLEYFLSDVHKNSGEEYARLYSLLSDAAKSCLKESYEYTEKYSGSYIYQAAEGINSSYIGAHDKNGSFSYSAVCRYVTQYLLYS